MTVGRVALFVAVVLVVLYVIRERGYDDARRMAREERKRKAKKR